MVDCKLDVLKTEFSPFRIILHIELIPLDSEGFDLPITEVGKKLSAAANYIVATFAVRASQLGPNKDGKAVTKNDKPLVFTEAKRVKEGNERVLKVLEGDLARAKEEKNPVAIEKATLAIEQTKKMIATQSERGLV